MIYLEINQVYFEKIGINLCNTERIKILKAWITFVWSFILIGPVYCCLTSLYLYHHQNELEKSTIAISLFFGCIACSSQLLLIKLDEMKLGAFIHHLQRFIDNAPEKQKMFYDLSEIKGRRLSSVAFKFIVTALNIFVVLFSVFSACYNIMKSNYDTSQWFEAYQIRFPFDQHTIPEYFMHMLLNLVFSNTYMTISTAFLTFFNNCCLLIKAGCDHMQAICLEIDQIAIRRRSPENFVQMKSYVLQLIETHVNLNMLANQLVEIMSGPVFFQVLCNIIVSSMCLFTTENASMKLSIDAVIAAYGLLFGIFWIFAYCYIGDYVSSCFDRIDGMLWQTHWYHCPTELQTLLIFIIRRAQVPFRFDGLKMFFCNLVTFATTMRVILTYYLALRKLRQT